MRITKFGHSCLFIEDGQARILIDPGSYVFMNDAGELPSSTAPLNDAEGSRGTACDHSCAYHAAVRGTTRKLKPEDLPACNVLLLTHEHPDHTYPEALKIILQKSKPAILTNAGVQKVLREHGIDSEMLGRGEERTAHGVTIRGIACDHGLIAEHIPRCENTGFLIEGRLFHPGDCVAPSEEVQAEILAVPVVAPWMKISEGLEFVKNLKPKFAIPIHDGFLKWPERPWYTIFETGLKDTGTQFVPLKIGEAREF